MQKANLPDSERTTRLLLLSALESGERTGFQLICLLEKMGEPAFTLREAAIYPVLYRMEYDGLVSARMHPTVDGPRRFYRLTRQGIRTLRRVHEHASLLRASGISMEGGGACVRKSD